jgi:hypothetical protein
MLPEPAYKASWKGHRYSSCSVLSSILDDTPSMPGSLLAVFESCLFVSCYYQLEEMTCQILTPAKPLSYLIRKEVLSRCNDADFLYTFHGFISELTSKIRISREALPIPSSCNYSAHGANGRSEEEIDALQSELHTHMTGTLMYEVSIPPKLHQYNRL